MTAQERARFVEAALAGVQYECDCRLQRSACSGPAIWSISWIPDDPNDRFNHVHRCTRHARLVAEHSLAAKYTITHVVTGKRFK